MSTLHLNNKHLDNHGFEKLVEYQTIALKQVKSLAGDIGIIVTYPLFFVARVVILFTARSMYKTASKARRVLLSEISTLSDRELIEAHLEIKNLNSEVSSDTRYMEKIINRSFPKGIIKEHVLSYIFETSHIISEAEKILKTAAYPSSVTPLTLEQLLEKKDKFKKWDDDWQDDAYNVYEAVGNH